jgi:hypothetical protein
MDFIDWGRGRGGSDLGNLRRKRKAHTGHCTRGEEVKVRRSLEGKAQKLAISKYQAVGIKIGVKPVR